MNKLRTAVIAGTVVSAMLWPVAEATIAHAAPVETINLTEVPDIDSLPVCVQEDCSDQPQQIGVWMDPDTGDWYLERGEDYTRAIIDDTVW